MWCTEFKKYLDGRQYGRICVLLTDWIAGVVIVVATLFLSPHGIGGRVLYAIFYAGWWMIISEWTIVKIFRHFDRR